MNTLDGKKNGDSKQGGPESGRGRTRKLPPKVRAIPKHGYLERIRRLHCYPEVDRMVREGMFLRAVAHFIKHQRGELTSMSDEALIMMLREYRAHLMAGGDLSDSASIAGSPSREGHPHAELFTLQEAFDLLWNRVQMEARTEMSLNKLFSTTWREFYSLKELGDQIFKMKDRLGLLDEKVLTAGAQSGAMPGKLGVTKLLADPEARQRVMGAMEAIVNNPDVMRGMIETGKSEISRDLQGVGGGGKKDRELNKQRLAVIDIEPEKEVKKKGKSGKKKKEKT